MKKKTKGLLLGFSPVIVYIVGFGVLIYKELKNIKLD